MRGDACDIDDAAAPALAHGRAEFLRGQEGAADEVEVKIGTPVRWIDLFKRTLGGDGDGGVIAAGGADKDGGGAKGPLDGQVSIR